MPSSAPATSDVLLELEQAHCDLCGETGGKVVYEGYDVEFKTCANRFTFIACANCNHIYLNPRPKIEDLGIIYANYLTTNAQSAYYPSKLIAWVKCNVFDKSRMRHVLKALSNGGNVLDIGAGSGRLLKLIAEISSGDCTLYASELEFDADTRAMLEHVGIIPIDGPIEAWETDLHFDAITGIHVIEHVYDADAVFRWISDHLNPGGVLYFETPDAEALCGKIFGRRWGMTHFPRHTNLFSKEKLRTLAERHGLTVVKHGGTTSAPAWNMSIRNTVGLDALSKHRSVFEIFNYQNVATLGFFTIIDITLLTLGIHTSTQQLICVKTDPVNE